MEDGIVCVCFFALVFMLIILASRLNHLGKELDCLHDSMYETMQAQDKLSARLSDLDEKVSEAYDVVEAQARQEKLMFDGLNSIMDYDINEARKAVRNNG